MMNRSVRKGRIGLVFGALSALFLGVAGMVVAPTAEGATAEGTHADAAVAWYVGYTDDQRMTDCRTAWRTGDMVSVVESDRGEALRDNFRNGEQMIEWTARMGVADCQARGFGNVR